MTVEERKQLKAEYMEKIRELEREEKKEAAAKRKAERKRASAVIEKYLGMTLHEAEQMKEKVAALEKENAELRRKTMPTGDRNPVPVGDKKTPAMEKNVAAQTGGFFSSMTPQTGQG